MNSFEIYCDDLVEATWFQALTGHLDRAAIHRIGRRGTNPPHVEELIRYDRPDIILLRGRAPWLVLEKTREVPTGHNVGQRLGRIARAAELKVPVIKYFPYDARKHGTFAAICNLNARLLFAFEKMMQIHGAPVLAVNWPATAAGELIRGGSELAELQPLVNGLVGRSSAVDYSAADTTRKAMLREYRDRITRRPAYQDLPGSARMVLTASLSGAFSAETLRKLVRFTESVVYRIGMTEEACRREDPYTGTQFIYDYGWCRSGPRVDEKHRNLILEFPRIRRAVWLKRNPNDPTRKSSNWYLTANAMLFRDGDLHLR